MRDAKRYLQSVLDTDLSQDILLVGMGAEGPALAGGDVVFTVSVVRKRPLPGELYFDKDEPVNGKLHCRLRFYTGGILRMMFSRAQQDFVDDSPMLDRDPELQPIPARLRDGGPAGAPGFC